MSDLTPEQAARCDALAKRIAELDPHWHKPGMACATKQGAWRRTSDCWAWDADGSWPGGPAPNDPLAGIDATIAAGPDWRDPATLGALLLSLGADGVAVARMVAVPMWRAVVEPGFSAPAADTRVGAILAAKVAQLEANEQSL